MTRVSENSNKAALNFAVGKAKKKLEDLQLKGSTLKRIMKPSDDPIGNVELLSIRSQNIDAKQYHKNANFARTQIEATESALSDLSDIINQAKQIAIAQSSDIYNSSIRKSVSNEVKQLYFQSLAIANRRIGSRYIFGGHKTLSQPFDKDGNYSGDEGRIHLEVSKDVFSPINLHGQEVFFIQADKGTDVEPNFDELIPQKGMDPNNPNRELASTKPAPPPVEALPDPGTTVFDLLKNLENALMTNSPELIQDMLPQLDDALDKVITLRTRVGSIGNSIENAELSLEKYELSNATKKSKIEDADVAELFSDLQRHKDLLDATYKAGSKLINRTLVDFLN